MVSRFRTYELPGEYSSDWGDTAVIAALNLSKGNIVNKIETAYGRYSDISCIGGDLAQIGGETFLIAKKDSATTAGSCEGTLNIPWKPYQAGAFQYVLINALTLTPGKIIESKILNGWEDRPFGFSPNTYLDSVTYVNGKAALRSSFANMTLTENKSVYVDLASGKQIVGPFGEASFSVANEVVSVGYSTDPKKGSVHVNSMDQSGAQTLEAVAPACIYGKCDLASSNESLGGVVASKSQLFFFSVGNYPTFKASILRLR